MNNTTVQEDRCACSATCAGIWQKARPGTGSSKAASRSLLKLSSAPQGKRNVNIQLFNDAGMKKEVKEIGEVDVLLQEKQQNTCADHTKVAAKCPALAKAGHCTNAQVLYLCPNSCNQCPPIAPWITKKLSDLKISKLTVTGLTSALKRFAPEKEKITISYNACLKREADALKADIDKYKSAPSPPPSRNWHTCETMMPSTNEQQQHHSLYEPSVSPFGGAYNTRRATKCVLTGPACITIPAEDSDMKTDGIAIVYSPGTRGRKISMSDKTVLSSAQTRRRASGSTCKCDPRCATCKETRMRVPFNKPYTTNTTYIRNDRFTCTSCHQAEIPTENLLSESYRKKFLSDPNRTATTGGGIYYHNDRKLDVFALSSSNSGTGTCLPYPMQPFVACAELGTDERGTQYKANITCTKVVKQLDLTDSRDLPQGAQAHFKKALGYGSMYTAVCNVLKKAHLPR